MVSNVLTVSRSLFHCVCVCVSEKSKVDFTKLTLNQAKRLEMESQVCVYVMVYTSYADINTCIIVRYVHCNRLEH